MYFGVQVPAGDEGVHDDGQREAGRDGGPLHRHEVKGNKMEALS